MHRATAATFTDMELPIQRRTKVKHAEDVKPFDGMDRTNILKTMRKGNLPKLSWPKEETDAWP